MNYALIFSRMSSSRLPGKAMISLGEKTLIERCIDGVKRSKCLEPIVLTSADPSDNVLVNFLEDKKINFFRGDLENIAVRASLFLKQNPCEYFARVNGDSPLIRGELLDYALENAKRKKLDFITNIFPDRSYPYGISIEIFKTNLFISQLEKINQVNNEHFSQFFYANHELFKYECIKLKKDLSNIRLTIDTKDDVISFMRNNAKYPELFNFDIEQIIEKLS